MEMDKKQKINSQEFAYKDAVEELHYPQGIKWTRQRKKVYRVLWEATEPLNAAQVYSRVEQETDGEEYALSTIYRILAAFEENGLVEKTTWLGDGTVVYSLNRGEHTHYAVCLECHRRIPLQSCPFAHIHLEKEAGDFVITGHKLELYGYCKECREAESMD
ncbi:MAG: Fur family transcriptional regulator [Acetatifactor sp.]